MAWRALLSICHVCLSEQHTASSTTILFALQGVRLAPNSWAPRDRQSSPRIETVPRKFMGGSHEQPEEAENEGQVPNWGRIQTTLYSFTSLLRRRWN